MAGMRDLWEDMLLEIWHEVYRDDEHDRFHDMSSLPEKMHDPEWVGKHRPALSPCFCGRDRFWQISEDGIISSTSHPSETIWLDDLIVTRGLEMAGNPEKGSVPKKERMEFCLFDCYPD